jgi:hypothetical protein
VATIKLKARSFGVDGVLRRFATASSLLSVDTREAQRKLGKVAEVVFGGWVPVKSGRALRGISSGSGGGVVTVTDYASNPATGYDYIGVTRWGHGIIRPRETGSASVLATGKRRGGSALRFVIGGRVVYAAYVRAWKPASDWVTDALPEVDSAAQVVAAELGRRIESRF